MSILQFCVINVICVFIHQRYFYVFWYNTIVISSTNIYYQNYHTPTQTKHTKQFYNTQILCTCATPYYDYTKANFTYITPSIHYHIQSNSPIITFCCPLLDYGLFQKIKFLFVRLKNPSEQDTTNIKYQNSIF